MRFSSGLAKTFPFASHAMQVGFSDASTKMIGPAMSEGVSADTHVWSSGGSSISFSAASAVGADCLRAFVFVLVPVSRSRCLRFFGLSPLNVSGFTMVGSMISGLGVILW